MSPAPAGAAEKPDPAGIAFFETKIRPVLVKQCYSCHSAAAAKQNQLMAGLALDTREGLLKGGESGPSLVPGEPGASLLLRTLHHAGKAPKMPPAGKLPAPVIADFEQWIKMGAPDPRTGATVAVKKGMTVEEGRKFWSFRPPTVPRLPAVRDTAWPRGTIDRFVLARLEQQKLRPVREADLRSLIRRVTFDLIGIPPTPEEVEQFLKECAPRGETHTGKLARLTEPGTEGRRQKAEGSGLGTRKPAGPRVETTRLTNPSPPSRTGNPGPGPAPTRNAERGTRNFNHPGGGGAPNLDRAYERVVDRLLGSKHFGERWGRHWLDAARYADSNGRDRNIFWYHAWRYRNYVIDSFNADKPYDHFIREQIAGDLLPAGSPSQRDEQRIATGFLAMGPKSFEELKPEVFRMDMIDEQIDVIGRSVLGLSIACARCHDHKFDPIPTKDYYALAGILRSTETLYGYGPRGIKATAFHHTELQPLGPDAERLTEPAREYYRKLQAQNLAFNTARSDRYRVVRRVADAKNQLQKPGADQAALQQSIVQMEAEIRDWDARIKKLQDELNALIDSPPAEPAWAMGVRERAMPENCRVHVRGETTNLGNEVPRGTLQVISLSGAASPDPAGSGRLQLAEWLTHPRNPLTARVFVNRVWLHLFGRGLVSTPDDFGVTGSPPSHPELLDYLASSFVDHWSLKRLIREIVLSRTYRLATDAVPANLEKDPDNIYLWRMSPRRLDAEVFRDAIMAVSGQLDPNPPERPFLARFHPRREDEYRTFQPVILPPQIEHPHRSVYLPVIRGVLPEIYSLFDFASPERPVAQREESTVPSQALYLMNSPWVIAQARHTAERLLGDSSLTDGDRVRLLYRLAFSRDPNAGETARAQEYLNAPESLLADPKQKIPPTPEDLRKERWTSLCQAVFASGEFRYLR